MKRITVSLPDELETQLDDYAQQQNKSVSAIVVEALQALLNGGAASNPAPPSAPAPPSPIPTPPVTTPPAPSPEKPAPDDGFDPMAIEVRAYIEYLAVEMRFMLETLRDLSTKPGFAPQHMPPAELQGPPWES